MRILQLISAWEIANWIWIKLAGCFLDFLITQIIYPNLDSIAPSLPVGNPAWISWANDTSVFLAATQGETAIRTFQNWWFHLPSIKKKAPISLQAIFFLINLSVYDCFFLQSSWILELESLSNDSFFFFWLEKQVPFRMKNLQHAASHWWRRVKTLK